MYEQLEAQLHDVFWAADENGSKEIGLIKGLLSESSGKSLELGCGSGRVLAPLLERGYQVDGLERSETMVRLCHQNLEKAELQTTVHEMDMQHFDLGGKRYQNILIPAFSLQLLPNQAAVDECLDRVFDHLEPGGNLYFSVFIPWAELLGELPEDEWYDDAEVDLKGGGKARLKTSFALHLMEQRLMREHQYELLDAEGNVTQQEHTAMPIRFFYLNELRLILSRKLFRILHVFPDFEPRQIGDHEMPACLSIVARRRRSLAQRREGDQSLQGSELEQF
mgnify:CR=1 FL=1